MNLTECASEIKRQDTKIVADKYFKPARKRGYNCDDCGNGTGSNGTGMEIYYNTHNKRHELKCQKCGKNYNNLEIIAHGENLNLDDKKDLVSAVKIGCEIYGLTLDDYHSTVAQKQQSQNNADNLPIIDNDKELEMIHADIKTAQEDLEKLNKKYMEKDETLNFRALTYDTVKYFGCGLSSSWKHPKNRIENKFVSTSRRFIIPTPNHYNAVMFPEDRTPENKSFWKMHAGTKEIFGAEFLPVDVDMILITEGELDAMSIWQATDGKYSVIAIGGAADYLKAVKFLENKFNAHKPKIFILFDSDDTGRANAPKFCEELLKIGFPAVYKFLSNDNSKIDANQILQEQGNEKLAEIISSIIADAQIDFETAEKEILITANFNNRANQWQKINGVIDSATLEELRQAEKSLNSLTTDDITAEIIFNSKRKIALCKVYDFCELSATSFITKIDKAIKTAANKISTARKDNSLPTLSDDVEVLANVSIRDFKADIKKFVSQVNKERKSFLQRYNEKISKQQHEKRLAEQRAFKKAHEEKIRQLQQAPLSDETVAEIVETINDNLEWHLDKHGMRVRVKSTAMNFKEIFSNDPNIRDLFAYDEFQQAIVFSKKPLWKKDNSCVGEMWHDTDDSELRIYLRETYKELAHEQMTYDYLISYAQKKSFHVVKDYFASLPKWDGVKRAEEVFIKFLHVDDTPYTREITIKFLLAAMARIYHPGCNFQSALVLQGAQSIGKSFVIEQLGGKWHTTLSDNVDDSHAIDALQNSWFVEMKEFSAARKADVNALKSFIERSADNRRSAYERRAKISKRHCVFAITVNDENFLRDQTGNRRFWILQCKSKMFEIVEGLTDEYIRQIWAEVKKIYAELFADGFNDKKLQLSLETKRRAEEIADNFMQDDGMKGEIEAFLQIKIPPKVIWQLLTKEQRRKFITDNSITIPESNVRALHSSTDTEFEDVLYNIDKYKKGGVTFKNGDNSGIKYFKFFGVELRQSICAAEILNECFGNSDRRKSPQKINEILPKIEGWQQGKRDKNYSGYGDQKKIYYRVNNEEINEEETHNFAQFNLNEEDDVYKPTSDPYYAIDDENIDDDDLPF